MKHLNELQNQINNLTEILGDLRDETPLEITQNAKNKIKERYTSNVTLSGVEVYKDSNVILLSKQCFKNWLYYAGLEYDITDIKMIELDGTVILDVLNSSSSRLSDLFNLLIDA